MKTVFKKVLATCLTVLIMVGTASLAVSAGNDAYTPNRSLTIQNISGERPIVQMGMVPFNLGENGGPYHVFGKIKIENFAKIDPTKDARVAIIVYYGNDGANAEKEVLLREWKADSNGWVDMVRENGTHIELEDFEDYGDAILRFTMENAKGDFTIADMIIADSENEVVYSLANDAQFTGITSYWSRLGVNHLWTPYYIDNVKSFVKVASNIKYNYTPNCELKLSIPANAAGVQPVVNAYVNPSFATKFPADKAPYTLRGMVKIENFAPNTLEGYSSFSNLARFYTGHDMGRVYTGNTDGWVPLLTPEGTPYVLKADTTNLVEKLMDFWQLFGSWGATGDFSLADFAVLDKDGNVAYSFKDDPLLLEQDYNLATGVGFLNLWYGFNGGSAGKYSYSEADTETTHTADEYLLKTVSETYTPYVAPATDPTDSTDATDSTTTTKPQGNVNTGVQGYPLVFVFGGIAVLAIALTYTKKKAVKSF